MVDGSAYGGSGTFPRAVLAIPLSGGLLLPGFIVDSPNHLQSGVIAGAPMAGVKTQPKLAPSFVAWSIVQLCYSANTRTVYAVERIGSPEAPVNRVMGPWGARTGDIHAPRIAMFTSPRDNESDYIVAVEDGQLIRLAYHRDKPASDTNPQRAVLATDARADSPLSTLVTSDGKVFVAYVTTKANTIVLSGADAADPTHITARDLHYLGFGNVTELLLAQTGDKKTWVFYGQAASGGLGELLLNDGTTDTGPQETATEICHTECRGLRPMSGPDGTDRVFFRYHRDGEITAGFHQDELEQLVYAQAPDRGNIMRGFWAGPLPVLSTENLPRVQPGADFQTLESMTAVTATTYDPFILDDGQRGFLTVSQGGPTSQRTVALPLTDQVAQGDYQPAGTFTFYGGYTPVAADEHWASTPATSMPHDSTVPPTIEMPTCTGKAPQSSAQSFVLFGEAQTGCGDVFAPWANSIDEARSCLESAGLSEAKRLCNYEVRLETQPSLYVYVRASSEENAISCARAMNCDSCTPTVSQTFDCTE